jgi:hypothetical protein
LSLPALHFGKSVVIPSNTCKIHCSDFAFSEAIGGFCKIYFSDFAFSKAIGDFCKIYFSDFAFSEAIDDFCKIPGSSFHIISQSIPPK